MVPVVAGVVGEPQLEKVVELGLENPAQNNVREQKVAIVSAGFCYADGFSV